MPLPTGFSSSSLEWEEPFLQTKFLAVGSSLGHLSMEKFFRSDLSAGTRPMGIWEDHIRAKEPYLQVVC